MQYPREELSRLLKIKTELQKKYLAALGGEFQTEENEVSRALAIELNAAAKAHADLLNKFLNTK